MNKELYEVSKLLIHSLDHIKQYVDSDADYAKKGFNVKDFSVIEVKERDINLMQYIGWLKNEIINFQKYSHDNKISQDDVYSVVDYYYKNNKTEVNGNRFDTFKKEMILFLISLKESD